MVTTPTSIELLRLFLQAQRLVVWIPIKISIDDGTKELAKKQRINIRLLNLYCVVVLLAVAFANAFTGFAGPWPSIKTFLNLLVIMQVVKSIPLFVYLVFVNRGASSNQDVSIIE